MCEKCHDLPNQNAPTSEKSQNANHTVQFSMIIYSTHENCTYQVHKCTVRYYKTM